MSIRNDSSLLQRARKNTPDISIATDQGNILEKDHIMVNVEMGTSPEQKPQTRQQQHRNRLRIYWNSYILKWLFILLLISLALLLGKSLTYGIHLPFSTRRYDKIEKSYYNGTHYFGPTVILISLDGFRNDYLERGVTPNIMNFGLKGVQADYMLPSFPVSDS
ncbi:hypothetical protein BJ944DRAFT_128002 [Cunninghamella echinulata]|nr:hypothetical protein BJ944DRAFT_128002 [Cunninghamella echinulata]